MVKYSKKTQSNKRKWINKKKSFESLFALIIIVIIVSSYVLTSCKTKQLTINCFNASEYSYTIIYYDSTFNIPFRNNVKALYIKMIDTNKLEEILSDFFKQYSESTTNKDELLLGMQINIKGVGNYNKQIIPFLDENNNEILWINCVHKETMCNLDSWRKKVVEINDGGVFHFNIFVSLKTKKCFGFSSNGQ